jgi:hypothetical protein
MVIHSEVKRDPASMPNFAKIKKAVEPKTQAYLTAVGLAPTAFGRSHGRATGCPG